MVWLLQHVPFRFWGFPLLKVGNFVSDSGYYYFTQHKRYDEYCSWLFPILSEMEKYADFTGYSSLEKRMYGLLAERLLNVYIRKNDWRVKHLFILEPERKLSAGMKLIYRIARVTSFYL